MRKLNTSEEKSIGDVEHDFIFNSFSGILSSWLLSTNKNNQKKKKEKKQKNKKNNPECITQVSPKKQDQQKGGGGRESRIIYKFKCLPYIFIN